MHATARVPPHRLTDYEVDAMTTSSAALIAALLGIALNNYSAEVTVSEAAEAATAAPAATPSSRPQVVPTAAPARDPAQPLKRQMAPLRPGDRFV